MKNNIIYWIIFFLLILFTGCSTLKTVELSGIAKNAKAGAVIISNDENNVYYIDNLDYWNDEVLNKSIIVTGKLDTVIYSDEGDMALSDFRVWRMLNPNGNIKEYVASIITSIGEMKFEEYNSSLISEEDIRKCINNLNYDDDYYIFNLDSTIIATGFGQFLDEGIIDKNILDVLKIAITRLSIWSKLKGWEEYENNLKSLMRILQNI